MMRSIILLHGAIGAADQLEPLSAALEQKQFSVHSFSFSGHGHIPFAEKFDIAQFADELEQFIKTRGLEKPAVFGYSMGGYVALRLACGRPQLLGTILTLGTKFAWSPESAQQEIRMLHVETIRQKVPKFAEALKARHGEAWEELLRRTATMMIALGDEPLLKDTDFAALDQQVLLGLADHDTMVTLDETLAVYKQLKQADMYMLPGAKHPIETVDPSLLADIITAYLAKV